MARQPGARTQVAFAFESVYGTPPASGYRRMPFATTTLGSEQGLLSPELLGYGRDPQAPIRDAVNVDGDVVIPMDAENLGFWLKAIFGQPVTTGTTPRTHTFQSGGFTLPSMAIETQMPDVPRFAMYSGLVADRIQWQSQRSGLLTATVGLIGRGETVAATTAAGVLTDATLPLLSPMDLMPLFRRCGTGPTEGVVRRIMTGEKAQWQIITDPVGGVTVAVADMMIMADEVYGFEEENDMVRRVAAGPGAATPYDWEGMNIALIVRIHDHGLPATQAELVAEMQDWFADRSDGKKMPDSRSIRRRITPIWRALRREEV